ncbi:MAG: hypothetical protein AAFQ82_22385 [Myxococcota bacterium]
MASYNTTSFVLECPRCGTRALTEVNLYFGNTSQMLHLNIGAEYPFFKNRAPQNGGPLPPSSPWGRGYAVCPKCSSDYHCACRIDDGRLSEILVNRKTPGFDPDTELDSKFLCIACESSNTRLHLFRGLDSARLICDDCGQMRLVDPNSGDVLPEELLWRRR